MFCAHIRSGNGQWLAGSECGEIFRRKRGMTAVETIRLYRSPCLPRAVTFSDSGSDSGFAGRRQQRADQHEQRAEGPVQLFELTRAF